MSDIAGSDMGPSGADSAEAFFELPWWVPWAFGIVVICLVGNIVKPPANVALPPSLKAQAESLADPTPKPLSLLAPFVTSKALKLDYRMSVALGELDALYQQRTDLQGFFGTGPDMNLGGLLQWANSDADSGSFRVAGYRSGFREALSVLNTPAAPPASTS